MAAKRVQKKSGSTKKRTSKKSSKTPEQREDVGLAPKPKPQNPQIGEAFKPEPAPKPKPEPKKPATRKKAAKRGA